MAALAGILRSRLSNPRDVRSGTLLVVVSAMFVLGLEAVRLPAALLLGPIAAAVLMAASGQSLRIPGGCFIAAQAVIGCMIARSMPLSTLGEILKDWPVFLLGIAAVITTSSWLGWLLTRWRILPGTTAIWGSSPGAAMAMILLADANGADFRLVAFMQYLRVVCVVVATSVVSRIWLPAGTPEAQIIWFAVIDWRAFVETLALIAVGSLAAPRLRIPAGPLLLPLVLGLVAQDGGGMQIELPPWLLAGSYIVIGWSIGLRFTRPILRQAARAFFAVLASTLVLIAMCGLLAVGLVVAAHVDPLTAYLATSPGSADAIAIIAGSSTVDLPFVMAMQSARLIIVILTGPSLARFVIRRAERRHRG